MKNAYLLDIGTTTLELCCLSDGGIVNRVHIQNPQFIYGHDVISRLKFCTDHGNAKCRSVLLETLCREISRIKTASPFDADVLYVAGNTAMLHILFDEGVSGLGVFPYTPVFLESQTRVIPELELLGIRHVISLPCLSAYVGADAVAGLYALGVCDGYRLLIDLGTNAEILLWNKDRLFATSAACGPCFEGGNISCGMPALSGAVSSFSLKNEKVVFATIDGAPARGICGSALFDIVAAMLDNSLCTKDGVMNSDFVVTDSIKFTQNDMRAFQLGKAAVATAVEMLLKEAGIDSTQIENVFLAGGFSGGINVTNAAKCGLCPACLAEKTTTVGNSVIEGLANYANGRSSLEALLAEASVLDLSLEDGFQATLMKNINF